MAHLPIEIYTFWEIMLSVDYRKESTSFRELLLITYVRSLEVRLMLGPSPISKEFTPNSSQGFAGEQHIIEPVRKSRLRFGTCHLPDLALAAY